MLTRSPAQVCLASSFAHGFQGVLLLPWSQLPLLPFTTHVIGQTIAVQFADSDEIRDTEWAGMLLGGDTAVLSEQISRHA